MDISEYPFIIRVTKLFMENTKRYCYSQYPGHKKGCPMTSRCWGKGGKQRMLTDRINVSKPMYIVFNEFDLKAHKKKMKRKLPHWTEKQCRNVIYWQPKARKQLQKKMLQALKLIYPRPNIISSGEGEGVNLYKTCEAAGLKLDSIGPDMKICRHMVILGYRKTLRRRII